MGVCVCLSMCVFGAEVRSDAISGERDGGVCNAGVSLHPAWLLALMVVVVNDGVAVVEVAVMWWRWWQWWW